MSHTRTGSKQHSHCSSTSRQVFSMYQVCCKPLLTKDRSNKRRLIKMSLLKLSSKQNQVRVNEWLYIYSVTTLSNSKSKLSVKLSKLFENSDVLKVVSEGCIAMSRNVAKAHSQITWTKFCNSKYRFCNIKPWKKSNILPTNISNKTYPNQQEKKLPQHLTILDQSLKCQLGASLCLKYFAEKWFMLSCWYY